VRLFVVKASNLTIMHMWIPREPENIWLAKQLLGSQEGICSLYLINCRKLKCCFKFASMLSSYWNETASMLSSYWNEIASMLSSYWNEIASMLSSYWNETASMLSSYWNETAEAAFHRADIRYYKAVSEMNCLSD
jgi:hypothetical protein